jgi:mRNA interferase RelE/StbE
MSVYEVIYYSKAEKQLSQINKKEARIIFDKISLLKDNPRPNMSIKLKGYEFHRLRIGNYRVIYKIDVKNKQVIIIAIKHRAQAYLNL